MKILTVEGIFTTGRHNGKACFELHMKEKDEKVRYKALLVCQPNFEKAVSKALSRMLTVSFPQEETQKEEPDALSFIEELGSMPADKRKGFTGGQT